MPEIFKMSDSVSDLSEGARRDYNFAADALRDLTRATGGNFSAETAAALVSASATMSLALEVRALRIQRATGGSAERDALRAVAGELQADNAQLIEQIRAMSKYPRKDAPQ